MESGMYITTHEASQGIFMNPTISNTNNAGFEIVEIEIVTLIVF
jgi:hypothetical protein